MAAYNLPALTISFKELLLTLTMKKGASKPLRNKRGHPVGVSACPDTI